MRLGVRYQLLLLVFVVLGVFYPAIFAGENSVDDMRMLQDVAGRNLDVFGLFRPSGGFYYRPLLMLTYHLDQYLWGDATTFMHLENVLLHLANVLLVFLVLKSLADSPDELTVSPLLGGLLFAVHPIVTESVNWISGRTDLLGTCFVLLATRVLLSAAGRRSLPLAWLGALLFACAVMSKEVMVCYFPVALLLVWFGTNGREGRGRLVAAFASPFVIAGLIYVGLRILTVSAAAHGVDDLLAKWHYDLWNTLRVTFKVFGFYVKKLFVPVPLNFTIRQVSDWYPLLGVAVAGLSVWLLAKYPRRFWPFAVAFWMTAPAIVVALTSVAWTPLAERYIYLSSAFACIGLAPLLPGLGRIVGHKAGTLALALLLFMATTVTAHRNLTWQDNLALYRDTLDKNPDFAAAHNEVGIALIESGRDQEAEKVLKNAIGQGMGTKNPLIYINLAKVYLKRKDLPLARRTLRESFTDPTKANLEVLKMLARVSETALRSDDLLGFQSREQFLTDMIETYRMIYARGGDPSQLYRAGQLLLTLGRRQEAAQVFTEVTVRAPHDAFYYQAAVKLASRLKLQDEKR